MAAVPALRTRGLTVRFAAVTAVDDVSLDVEAGRVTGVIGPNGAGKTTFVDAVCGLVPARGEIELGGRPITGWPAHKRARAMGRTFQGLELFDELTVQENLLIPAEAGRRWGFLTDLVRVRPNRHGAGAVADALERVGLTHAAHARPPELALGERQLASVARAIATGADVLLLDEPAAGLNSDETRRLGDTLQELARSGLAIVLVDHDMGLVLRVCDVVHVLEFGRCIASGTPEAIRADDTVIEAYLGDATPAVDAAAVEPR